jgi:predicted nucleotidyltransferase
MFNVLFLTIIFTIGISIFIGIGVGYLIIDPALSRALLVALKSSLRIIMKTVEKNGEQGINIHRLLLDHEFNALPQAIKRELIDETALQATLELKKQLLQRFGTRLEKIYLYGSRVRGDYQVDSDVDVAIFLNALSLDQEKITKEILVCTYRLLMDFGLYFQIRIYDSYVMNQTELSSDYLACAALFYGVSI